MLLLFSLIIITSCNTQNNNINEHVHDYSNEWTVDKEATCTDDGSKSHHCLTCDAKTDETIIPATGHNFSQWEIVLEATETSTGLKERECSVCHYIDEEVIPKLDYIHNYSSEWTVDVEPTCTEDGSKSHHCLVCDAKTDVTVIEALGHSYGSYEHNDEGHWKICSVCDYKLRSDHDFSLKDDLTLVCVCGLEKTVVSDLKFTLSEDGKSYTVNGFNGTSSEILIIPNEYNGLPVLTISDYAFNDKTILEKVYISEGIISIGSYVFRGCSSLTSIEIPSSVTSIGDRAFSGCSSLTDIVISSSVTSIGSYAFSGCSSLTSIEIPSSVTNIGSDAFYGCSSLTIYCEVSSKPSGWNTDWDYFNCPVVWNYKNNDIASDGYIYTVIDNIRYGIKNDEAMVKRQRYALEGDIEISQNINYKGKNYPVTSIGDSAFFYCSSLTSIEIPSSVTSIGDYAFYYCSSLTNIEIPSGITSIGDYAFYDCGSLTSIEIPSSVTSIGYSAFYGCGSLTSIEIPSSVTSIGDSAFYDCSSLTSIEIPSSVTSIGDYAFSYCSSLTSIEIPSSVTSIGSYAFYGCSSLTNVVIPNGVTSIGDSAFYYCSSLTIYCEVSSKPSGWDTDWNYSNCPVIWNYKNSGLN